MGAVSLISIFMIINSHLVATEIVTIYPTCAGISSYCITLAEYSPSSADSIEITLLPGSHVLRSPIQIVNKQSFSLQGPSSGVGNPTITCLQTDSISFQVDRITNISINNVVFVQCYIVGTGNNAVSISDTVFHSSRPHSGGVLKMTSGSNVTISRTTFQYLQVSVERGSVLEIRSINHLEVNSCNFSNITISNYSSVLELGSVNKALVVGCNFQKITLNLFGFVIEFYGKHISIFGSMFTRNTGHHQFGSIMRLEQQRTAIVSCSIFSYNYFSYRFNTLIEVHVRGGRNSLPSVSRIDATATISNCTFAHNNFGNFSSAIECERTCLIISSVFKNNSLQAHGDLIDLSDTTRYDCYDGDYIGHKTQYAILASLFAQNNFGQHSDILYSPQENTIVDCSSFPGAFPRSQTMNSIACNQLLYIGESGVCNACQGRVILIVH